MKNPNPQQTQWVRTTFTLGGMQIDGYTNGHGEYRLNLTQLAGLVKKPVRSCVEYLASAAFKVKWAKAQTEDEPVIKIAAPTGGYWNLVHTKAATFYISHQAIKLQVPEAADVLELLMEGSWEIRIQNSIAPITPERVAALQGQTPEWLYAREYTKRVHRNFSATNQLQHNHGAYVHDLITRRLTGYTACEAREDLPLIGDDPTIGLDHQPTPEALRVIGIAKHEYACLVQGTLNERIEQAIAVACKETGYKPMPLTLHDRLRAAQDRLVKEHG